MEKLTHISLGSSLVVCDTFSYENKPQIRQFLESAVLPQIIASVGKPCIVVLGGDGTMLRAIQFHYLKELPFLGINFGTKGFLLNDKNFITPQTQFKTLEYPLLESTVTTSTHTFRHVAFNEIQVKASAWEMIDLSCEIGKLSRMRVKSDGLLVVTPAGSTGYNRSAGGPILPHMACLYIVTPLLAWEPRGIRPVVYSQSETVTITNNTDRSRKLSVYADAIPIIEGTDSQITVQVGTYSKKIQLLIADSYEQMWQAKPFAEQWLEPLIEL